MSQKHENELPPTESPATPPPQADDRAQPDRSAHAEADEAPPPEVDWQRRHEELEARHAEVSDAYLRAKAEAENTRRRAEEDVSKARKFAIESFAESLLPVRDSLEAALALPQTSLEQLREGVEATLRQLSTALERNKVVAIDPACGERFDPHRHQAISVVALPPESTQEANAVVTVLQKGYLIADRVLRPALVTVSAANRSEA